MNAEIPGVIPGVISRETAGQPRCHTFRQKSRCHPRCHRYQNPTKHQVSPGVTTKTTTVTGSRFWGVGFLRTPQDPSTPHPTTNITTRPSDNRIDTPPNVNPMDIRERSPEEKGRALEVYAEHGLAEAHRQTGIPKPTLHKWARAAGLDTARIASEHAHRTSAATEARIVRCDAMREEMRERMLETAGTLLDRVDLPHVEYRGNQAKEVHYPTPPASACRDYVWATAVLVDKYRLEVGEVTDRSELIEANSVLAKERLAKIIDLAAERRAS